jgi:hypothetical protein
MLNQLTEVASFEFLELPWLEQFQRPHPFDGLSPDVVEHGVRYSLPWPVGKEVGDGVLRRHCSLDVNRMRV